MAGPEYITLDPEFEAILREVAADPNSALLRVARPQRIRGLFDRGGPIGPRASVLTKAERHLVEVHRGELAWLLRQAALVKLIEGPKGRLYASRYFRDGKEYPLMKPADLRWRAEQERGQSTSSGDEATALELVEKCVVDPFGDAPTAADLATAAFRLEPSDETRVLAAMDFAHGDSPRAALRVLRDVLTFEPPPELAASAWSYIGLVYSRMGIFERSRHAYATQCRLDPGRITAWMCRLGMSLQMGDEDEGLDVASHVNALAAGTESHVDRFVRSLSLQRGQGDWNPTAEAGRVARAVKDRRGDAAGRISDAIA